MKPFDQFPPELCKQIRYILTDIDDTLTTNGRLPASVFVAMERLKDAKIRSIPITGRPAGWCDHIARMWPVDGLVGENGAFYFRYDDSTRKIVSLFNEAGAVAKVSSIHVNGWFGEYDKLTMTRSLFAEVFRENLEDVKQDVIYIGDSPNDAPMFAYFPHSVGVANVLQFEGRMPCNPAWITRREGGHGFAEMVAKLLTF